MNLSSRLFRYQFVFFRAVILLTQPNDQPNETSQKFYFSTAVFYVSALVSSNSALRFISYPSQVIAKGKLNVRMWILQDNEKKYLQM